MVGGLIVLILDSEESHLAGETRPGLRRDDTLGILPIVLGLLEVDPADGVVDVELVLKTVRQDFRITDQEEVIGDSIVRVRRGVRLYACS